MNSALIVSENPGMSALLSAEIKKKIKIDVNVVTSYENTYKLLKHDNRISIAIVEPILSDDAQCDIVDLLIQYDIPVIVYTEPIANEMLDRIINKSIVDYVIQTTRNNMEVVINLMAQVIRHRQSTILIVDDSSTSRLQIKEALKNLPLSIKEVDNAQSALKMVKEEPDIKLMLVDYNMDGENGIDLTRILRKTHSNKQVSVIGYSAYGNPLLSADFLKNGANDFITKPFKKEEFVNRVLLQLDTINYIEKIKSISETDFLTGIYNRKYVYEVGRKLFENAKRGTLFLGCAMVDIDHFKKINDTYGHDAGDKVIIALADELTKTFRKSDIVGRIGGEEFCVVLTSPQEVPLEDIFDEFRKKVENLSVNVEDEYKNFYDINFTVSIGVTAVLTNSFEDMLKFADLKLYEAKNYGRNMVVI